MRQCLSALKNQGKPENAWLNFKFAIRVSGFKPSAKELVEIFSAPLNVPSLHVIGDTDVKVAPENSVELTTAFITAEIYKHSGGHFVPSDPATRDAFVAFVSKYICLSCAPSSVQRKKRTGKSFVVTLGNLQT